MFDVLKAMIGDLTGRKDEPADERVATAALLVHMIAIDGRVSPQEQSTLKSALSAHFGISGAEADHLIDLARMKAAEEADLFGVTSLLKRSLDADGRIRVIRLMWQVAFSDGAIHEFEDNVVWRIADLLDVPQRDRVSLRQSFLAGQGKSEDGA